MVEKPRTKMILEYMSGHEKYLGECLSKYEDEVPREIIDSGFEYQPEVTFQECFEENELNNEMSAAGVLRLALHLDDCFTNQIEKLIKNTHSSKIKNLFKNLLNIEDHEERKVVKEALELKTCKILKLFSLKEILNSN
jgi:hypothetical protein